MDALLALIFVFTLMVSGVVLFATLWIGSVNLILRPNWVADRVVGRFWPERPIDAAALRRYRITGCMGLALALAITWIMLLEVF